MLPAALERRRSVEPRKPEVAELDLTDSEWDALQGGDFPDTESPGLDR